jgi:malonyl CoA-acyl carrier protein transacylase
MGAGLFERRPDLLGETADGILGWSLRDMCLSGPAEALTKTDKAQVALFALGYATWAELSTLLDTPPASAAGHSLGEYTALTAAGVFDYETALRLVSIRGRAMATAAEREPSGMAALIGVGEREANQVAERRRAEGGRLWVANINAPGQVVVAGGSADIDWILAEGKALGVRRVVPLNVAGAFHSPFMASAAAEVEAAVRDVEMGAFTFPVYANVTGRPYSEGRVAELLGRQVVEPVRFAETLAAMDVEAFVHVGPGDVTAGMAKRTRSETIALVASDPETWTATAQRLNEGR